MPEQGFKCNHMAIPWHEYIQNQDQPISETTLSEKASVIGRIGLMLLSCGNRCMACAQFHEHDF